MTQNKYEWAAAKPIELIFILFSTFSIFFYFGFYLFHSQDLKIDLTKSFHLYKKE